MTTLTILYLLFAKNTSLKRNKLISPAVLKRVLYARVLKKKVKHYFSKILWKGSEI
tara:strand:+ start:41 stop:208 length:168 start_codon:yes stop_codon:yes gene_type:complete